MTRRCDNCRFWRADIPMDAQLASITCDKARNWVYYSEIGAGCSYWQHVRFYVRWWMALAARRKARKETR
jgi:hypothetical protein